MEYIFCWQSLSRNWNTQVSYQEIRTHTKQSRNRTYPNEWNFRAGKGRAFNAPFKTALSKVSRSIKVSCLPRRKSKSLPVRKIDYNGHWETKKMNTFLRAVQVVSIIWKNLFSQRFILNWLRANLSTIYKYMPHSVVTWIILFYGIPWGEINSLKFTELSSK